MNDLGEKKEEELKYEVTWVWEENVRIVLEKRSDGYWFRRS